MKTKILISVLVPVYGVEKYIERCACSLFMQTYENIEYIFVNDCTPDKSITVLLQTLETFPKRKECVRIINHEQNKGLAAARNTAVKCATGKYVMHVDSDDYLEIDAVEKAALKAYDTNADVVLFDVRHVFLNKVVVTHSVIPNNRTEYVKRIIERECAVNMWGGIYKRSLYIQHNVWAIEGLNYGEDYVVKPRLIYYAQKVVYIKESLYNYVHYNSNSYTKVFSEKNILDQEMAIEILTNFFSSVCDSEEYKHSLNIAALKVKAELLVVWGLFNGNKRTWKKIVILYPSIPLINVGNLKYLIILWASQMNLYFFVRWYSKIGVLVKQLLK
ncbi:glycosyltransferase [uncultured Bacteroides sp.]|uniref:glycosyltransferase family 2 protein n=1 Tax=uncultured Bacteroides sp. TaxID=162156 RepID=UPI002596FCCF|nr:glycosyltransferase [uncultured Bacteroides sp.]